MKPKNTKERKKTFLRFLLIFILTMVAMLVAVFFNFRIPKEENAILTEKIKSVDLEMKYQENFSKEMKIVKNMIDSLDVPGAQVSYQNELITKRLAKLQNAVPTKDSTFKYDMYTDIVRLYVELQDAKKELRSLTDAKSTIQEYKDALDKCRCELKQTECDLYIARSSK